jgi:GWxTD domain-containing protein
MRASRRQSLFVFAAVFLMAAVAHGQLSQEYADWADGPAGFLLTKDEQKEWESITTDAAAKDFIELFWARRNPQPDTPFNPFKAEFDAKVKYAEENFSYPGHNGATTDRARVLILMGRPEGVQNKVPEQTVQGLGTTAGGTDEVRGNSQVWFYNPGELPAGFKVKGSQLYFLFYEDKMGSNNFILDRSARESFKGLSALADAPDVYLLHPEMTEIPKPVSIAGGRQAPADHLAWLGKELPLNESVRVLSELGVNDGVTRPLWLDIEMPADGPTVEYFTGQVEDADGNILSNFEIDAVPFAGQYGTAYHISIPLAVGTYTVKMVGAAGDSPLLTESIDITVEDVPEEGVWMSPIWLGLSAAPNEQAKLGDPYSFGGWQLSPVTGPDFTRSNEIVFFGFVVRPEVNPEGAVNLEARIRVKKDGKTLGRPLTMPLDASQVIGDLYMYGSSIALSGLPETGSYEFVFKVTQGTSETSSEVSLPVDIAE